MPSFERSSLFEEALGCDSEKLGWVDGAVVIEYGWASQTAIAFESFELGVQDPGPRNILTALFQEWSSVAGAILSIQLMSEFMQDKVSAARKVRRPRADFIP